MMTSSPGSRKAMNALNMPAGGGRQRASPGIKSRITNRTFVSARGDGDLGLGIQRPPPECRVGIRDGRLQPRAPFGGTVLVADDAVERLLGGVQNELRRVVSIEALAHIHDGLLRRGGRSLVDDGPARTSARRWLYLVGMLPIRHRTTYHSSCLIPETLAAGFSFAVAAMAVVWKPLVERIARRVNVVYVRPRMSPVYLVLRLRERRLRLLIRAVA